MEWTKIKSKCEICGNVFEKGENTSRTTCSQTCSTTKWRKENPDKKKEYDKQYTKDNAEKLRQNAREWVKNNKEAKLAYDREYQRKKREANKKK